MDAMALYDLGRILYEDRLREAERRERLWRSSSFHKLPRLVQVFLAAFS